VTVSEGMLRIHAERREEDKSEGKGYLRHELRRGPSPGTCRSPGALPRQTSRRPTSTGSSRSAFRCPRQKSSNPRRSPSRPPDLACGARTGVRAPLRRTDAQHTRSGSCPESPRALVRGSRS
jgi:hypothetical protein